MSRTAWVVSFGSVETVSSETEGYLENSWCVMLDAGKRPFLQIKMSLCSLGIQFFGDIVGACFRFWVRIPEKEGEFGWDAKLEAALAAWLVF